VEEQATSNTTRSLDGALYASLAHLKGNNVSAAADLVRHATLAKPATYVGPDVPSSMHWRARVCVGLTACLSW
jgi:hypothetical protein